MLLLLFQAANRTFGLDASCILEVTPVPEFRAAPQAPAYIAGLMNYRGRTIPVLDLTRLIEGRASRPAFSTRLLLARYEPGGPGAVLGLVAERAVETLSCSESDFAPAGISVPDTPYLGEAAILNGRMVQRLSLDEALGEQARALLFSAA
jgi:chemotaxis-related protein WspB